MTFTDSRMSSLTAEWQLKRENGIKYWIDIEDFSKKMKWPVGKPLYSRVFMISTSTFKVEIFPNGGTKTEKGHVSVYLCNQSDWRVRISATFKVGHVEDNIEPKYLQAADDDNDEDGWGAGKLVSHKKIRQDSLLVDGRFTLEVDVELLEEEIPCSRPTEKASYDVKHEVSLLKSELVAQRNEATTRHKALKHELRQLKDSLRASSLTDSVDSVDCPACLEVVKPPMRLKQCGEGHVICDSCFDLNPNKRCTICRGPITGCKNQELYRPVIVSTGRPTALENLLGLTS